MKDYFLIVPFYQRENWEKIKRINAFKKFWNNRTKKILCFLAEEEQERIKRREK